MKTYLLPAALALALTACGGSSDNGSAAPAPVAVDAFTSLVQSQYMDQSETADPQPIDTVTATMPEMSEPIAI